jgi:hypothetical protein
VSSVGVSVRNNLKSLFSLRYLVLTENRVSSAGIKTGYGLDSQVLNPGRGKLFLFIIEFRSVLGSIQPSIQWVRRVISLRVKRLEREIYLSPPSSAEAKNGGDIPPLPHISSWFCT